MAGRSEIPYSKVVKYALYARQFEGDLGTQMPRYFASVVKYYQQLTPEKYFGAIWKSLKKYRGTTPPPAVAYHVTWSSNTDLLFGKPAIDVSRKRVIEKLQKWTLNATKLDLEKYPELAKDILYGLASLVATAIMYVHAGSIMRNTYHRDLRVLMGLFSLPGLMPTRPCHTGVLITACTVTEIVDRNLLSMTYRVGDRMVKSNAAGVEHAWLCVGQLFHQYGRFFNYHNFIREEERLACKWRWAICSRIFGEDMQLFRNNRVFQTKGALANACLSQASELLSSCRDLVSIRTERYLLKTEEGRAISRRAKVKHQGDMWTDDVVKWFHACLVAGLEMHPGQITDPVLDEIAHAGSVWVPQSELKLDVVIAFLEWARKSSSEHSTEWRDYAIRHRATGAEETENLQQYLESVNDDEALEELSAAIAEEEEEVESACPPSPPSSTTSRLRGFQDEVQDLDVDSDFPDYSSASEWEDEGWEVADHGEVVGSGIDTLAGLLGWVLSEL